MAEHGEKKAEEGAPKKGSKGLIIGLVVGVVVLLGGTAAAVLLVLPGLKGDSAEHAAAEGGGDEESGGHGEKKEAEHGEKKEAGGHGEKKESGGHGEKKKEGGGHGAGAEITLAEIPPIVVDLRDEEGRLRHLKVGLAVELSDGSKPEEFKAYVPRAREATLTYLRSLTFETASEPTQYATIKQELANRVTEAVGHDLVSRVLLVDFVSQ